MGDPKKPKKKYSTPTHPWEKTRIEEEKILVKEYGIKNKKELWKLESKLKNFKDQIKKLVSLTDEQAEKEKVQLMKKLHSLGLIKENAQPGDVLGLSLRDIMERRLQTIVFKKGLARSIKQSRQFIVHGHIFVGDKKVTVPNYLVKVTDESSLSFDPKSSLSDKMHPERIELKKAEKVKKVKGKKKEEEEIISEEELKEVEEIEQ